MRRGLALVGLAVLLVGAGAAVSLARKTPLGQPRLGEAEALRPAFEAWPGPKLILLLSPHCPTCLETASAMQRALETDATASVHVFLAWTRVLRGDALGPSQAALGRVFDARVSQYVDRSNRVAEGLCSSTPSLRSLCTQSPVLFGAVLLYEPGARWGDAPTFAAFDAVPPLHERR